MTVRDVMTYRAACCDLDSTLAAAAELMCSRGCGFLPVISEGGNVIGVITDRDICVALGTHDARPSEITVRSVILPPDSMVPKLFTCTPEDDIHCALKTMRIEKIRRMPVVDRDGSLQGILSMDEIVLGACLDSPKHGLSCKDVIDTWKIICGHRPAGCHPPKAA